MPTIRRILAGRKAKAQGQIFENLFKNTAFRFGFHVFHIPMGAKQVSANKMIRVLTPCDFILWHELGAAAIDVKSTSKSTFSYTDTTTHQLTDLLKVEFLGFMAGYVIHFRELNKISFISARRLTRLKARESVRPEDGILLGSMNNLSLRPILDELGRLRQQGLQINLKEAITQSVQRDPLPETEADTPVGAAHRKLPESE